MGNSGIYEAEIKQQLSTMAGLCVPESSSNMFKGVKFRQLPEELSSRSQAERDAYVEQVYMHDIPFEKHPDLFTLHPYLIVGGLLLEEVPHQSQPCMTIELYGLVSDPAMLCRIYIYLLVLPRFAT